MRKTAVVQITDAGRDSGKVFILKEMPASKTEKWAARAVLALARSGVDIPEDIAASGIAGIARLGVKALAGMTFPDAESLMDEMFECVSISPDPNHPEVVRAIIEDDIEEVTTRVRLRAEVFNLHASFFFRDGP